MVPARLTEPVVVSRLRAAGCVFAEEEAALLLAAGGTADALMDRVEQRVAGRPLEQVLGWAQFFGRRVVIEPGVFVPRRRSELLVREAVRHVDRRPGVVVLDLCCGSGALGAAVADALTEAELHAADVHPAAVACARRNVAAAGGLVYEGDLFQPLPVSLQGRVDLLLANVPYVPTEAIATMPPEARDHEPRVALDGGDDGLTVLRRVAVDAARWLAPGGLLLVETSAQQASAAAATFGSHGLSPQVVSSEELGATVVIGARAPAPAREAAREAAPGAAPPHAPGSP